MEANVGDNRALVIGANELKLLSLTLCMRFDSLFLVHFQPELSNTDSTRYTLGVQHIWQWWVTFMVWKFALLVCANLDFFFHSFFLYFVRSVRVSSRFYGFCSVFLGVYISLFYHCLCVHVYKSIKKESGKTLKSTTQFQKLTDYLQLVVCVVLRWYISLCNVRKAFNAPHKQIDEQQIKTHTHTQTANTRHSHSHSHENTFV